MLRLRKVLPTTALVALTSASVLVGSAATASASGPAACNDFGRMVIYYVDVGDQATALAVFDNMIAMGCE